MPMRTAIVGLLLFAATAAEADPGVERLVAQLGTGTEAERVSAAEALAHAEEKDNVTLAVGGLANAVKDPSPHVRAAAAAGLGRLTGAMDRLEAADANPLINRAVAALLPLLRERNGSARTAAETTLRGFAWNWLVAHEKFVAELAAIAGNEKEDRANRDAALDAAIAYWGSNSCRGVSALAPAALKDTADPDPARRRRAFYLLRLGNESSDATKAAGLRGVSDPDGPTRYEAACVLARVDPDNPLVVRTLVDLLEDNNAGRLAGYTLSYFGAAAWKEKSKLLRYLRDGNNEVKLSVLSVIREIGEPAVEAVPLLLPLLSSPSNEIRSMTAFALGGIGPRAHRAAGALLAMAARGPERDTSAALGALVAIGHSDAIPLLLIAFTDKSHHISGPAWRGLLDLGHPALPALTKLGETNYEARMLAHRVRYAEPVRVPEFARVLACDDAEDRLFAIRCLAEYGPKAKAALPELRKLLDDPVPMVRLPAASAILQIDPADESPMPRLSLVLRAGLPADRITAAVLLHTAGPHAAPAREGLICALADPIECVRNLASATLERIRTGR